MVRKRRYLDETEVSKEANQVIKDKFTVNGVTYGTIPSHYTKGKIANSKTKSDITSDRVYVRQGDDGKWYQTRMDKDANNINYYLDNKALIDRSNEIIESQSKQGIGHKIEVDKADARARQQWFSNEDATKFLLTTAGLGALGGGLISAPLATTLGFAGGYGGAKAVDAGMQKVTDQTWGQWINDKTGLPEWFSEFTNPGGIVGGGIGGKLGVNLGKSLRSYAPNVNYIKLVKALNNNIKNTRNLRTLANDANSKFSRTKVGDLIIEPQSSYRQGDYKTGADFLNTGKVRVISKVPPKVPGKIRLAKEFENPMFAQGKLWYGDPITMPSVNNQAVLVTRQPLAVAGKSSAMFDHPANGTWDVINVRAGNSGTRRVPLNENQLNLNNTQLYYFEPNYGYRRVNLTRKPIIDWNK